MAVRAGMRSDVEHAEHLHALLRERGLDRYGLFWVTGEGTVGPDGFEEASGYVVSSEGPVYYFWTGWNEQEGRSAFETWQPAEPEPDWAIDEEYQRALVAAGLH